MLRHGLRVAGGVAGARGRGVTVERPAVDVFLLAQALQLLAYDRDDGEAYDALEVAVQALDDEERWPCAWGEA